LAFQSAYDLNPSKTFLSLRLDSKPKAYLVFQNSKAVLS